jgi:acetyl-CoA carboxylase carboxyl transferase subunit alpha
MPNHKNNISQADYLAFEDQIAEIDKQISELSKLSSAKGIDYSAEIRALQKEQVSQLKRIYSDLSAWQTVQVARHPKRPLLDDYLRFMVNDFHELHGDRCFGDDKALITGLGQIGTEKVLIVGHKKGKTTQEKIVCNFGCANPEGYRKAIAKMRFAAKYNIPVVTFIDTPGAYPGIGAEERGQAQAIAANLQEMSVLPVPIICIVIGEGGSGGALGIGIGDKLAMLEYAYYSVISPEGCAAILWRDGSQAEQAAHSLKLTSKDLFKLGLIDSVISEPLGGAHRNVHDTIDAVEKYIVRTLGQLKRLSTETLLHNRYEKLRRLGEPMSAQLLRKTAPATQKVTAALNGLSAKSKYLTRHK